MPSSNSPCSETFFLAPDRDSRSIQLHGLGPTIARYYDECYVDYRVLWLNAHNLAIHYGYWDEETRSHSRSLLNMNRVLAEQAGIRSGQVVLDAGCGLGGSAIWLAEHHQVKVFGVTLAESQVRTARKFAKKRGLESQVEFGVADYCATPFASGSFDIVWGLESICYALDKRAFIKEAHRLLRPGGRLVVADGFAKRTTFNAVEWEAVRAFLDGWAVPNLVTPNQFQSYLEQSGFVDSAFTDITSNVMPSAKRMYRTAVLTTPIQKALDWIGIRTPAQTRNYHAALRQIELLKGGLACYGVVCAAKR
ncbi:MAG: SAM-dependent methyltransferase [Gammaproteobacteria bacterium]